jgi:SecD/SecF fusion protein
MKSSIYWKIAFSVLLLIWAIWNLYPLSDTPFDQYLAQRATANSAQLQTLIKHAQDLVEQAKQDEADQKAAEQAAAATKQVYLPDTAKADFINRHRTFYLSFKSICEDEGLAKGAPPPIDLWAQFFPSFNAGETKNIKHRNDLILTELLKESKGRIKYGLDLQGGLGFTLSLDDASLNGATANERAQSLQKAIEIINKRINGMGVSETVTRPIGDSSVEILMPGASSKDNPDVADQIKKPAKLEFRIAQAPPGGVAPSPDQIPLGSEVMMEQDESPETGDLVETPYIVASSAIASGNIISSAYPITDPGTGQFKVAVNFTSDGAKLMGDVTAKLVDTPQLLAIVLDGKLNSAPRVKEPFSSSCVVEGGGAGFTQKEAFDLANVLNNPLDKALKLDQMTEVGPTLATEARTSSIYAGLCGTALVVVFMCGIYSLAGVLSVVTLVLNVGMILGVQASLGATLTLPGVAALVLTIGMAVDANILIYERMREEMARGKNLFNSLEAGHDRALASILDSHVTSIITAAILIWLGTGPIKGFGVILAIGLASNLFCVLVFNYALLELVTGKNWLTKLNFRRLIPEVNLPFYSYRKIAIGCSIAVILIGLGAIAVRGASALGTDFRGGDEVSVNYAQAISQSDIESVAKSLKINEAESTYQTELGTGQQMLKIETEAGQGKPLLAALAQKFPQAKLDVDKASVNLIGATVSQSLKWNALLAVGLSLLGVMVYVAFRFEVGYAVGAIVATLHDVIITVGVYVLLGGQFTSPMVAAVLMIIGYSLNDTVIVFDRVREELKLNPHLKLVQVLDLAVNKTFARTTMTSMTVFLAAFSLFLFGAGVVHEFALVFMIGIATGTASSIFIANPVFCWWHKGDRNHVEAREFAPKYEWDSSTRGTPAAK